MKRISFQWLMPLFLVALGIGLYLRCWHITANQFLFYDEGMYLGYNRNFLHLVADNPPKNISEFFIILGLMFKVALSTAKALWFFILNLRVFIVGPEDWSYARIISGLSGIATIALTYFFSFRYFKSKNIAFLSAIFLCLLPSHVFYSRLGMQESFSTLLFLSAIIIYVLFRKNIWSPFVTALLLFCVFSTNYRMIISPIFIIAIECYEAFSNKTKIDFQRMLICTGIFALIVILVGSLYGGINRQVTFGWMMHQAQEAKEQGNVLSFLSYPYYTFVLEGLFFALIFWSNLYLVFKKQWPKLLPFILVLIQMGLFSFAAEKGARYICVLLPMMAVAGAVALDYFLSSSIKKIYLYGLIALTCISMLIISLEIMNSKTDYQLAVESILRQDPNAKILATQPLVEQLYIKDEKNIQECPKNLQDFISFYKQGFRYLILDPQVYISWTKDTRRFSPPLIDFLEYIKDNVKPLQSFAHLNKLTMERFVLDHNQNLSKSIEFLSEANKFQYGEIRVYDVQECLLMLKKQALQAPGVNL